MTLHTIRYGSLATLALSLAACSDGGPNAATTVSAAAASPPSATVTRPQHAALAAPAAPSGTKPAEFVTGTLCTQPDQVVFSCPLEKTHKIVSICAAGDAAPHRFYYAFGKTDAPELVYPSKSDPAADQLHRTNLVYAAGTAGDAYSFHQHGYEYIAFIVSGKSFANSGVIVRRDNASRALMHLKCDGTKAIQSENNVLLDEVFEMKSEEDLKGGLPNDQLGYRP